MANVNIKDAVDASKYLKTSGAGSDGDPYVPEHLETNSAAIKTAVELLDNAISGARMLVTEDNSAAIKTAVELLDNAISGSRMLVTEDNSAAIKTAVELLDNAIDGAEMQVDIVAPLPAGTAEIGKLAAGSAAIGSVSVSSGAITETNSGAIKTAVELIDNVVDGSEMQVDVVTMPTVTETNSAAIKTAVEVLDNVVDGTEMQVDVVTMPTVTETNSAAIKTAVETLDNAVSGSEMQVDVVTLPALVTGSAAIGKLAANSGVDIGDVTLNAGSASIGTLGANSGVDIGDVTLNAGSASIGTLGANSGVDIGDVDVTSLPALAAGSNAIGKLTVNAGVDIGNVTSLLATDSLRNGTTAVTPAFVAINAAASGDNTLLAAQGSSNKIRVLALNIVVGDAVNVRLESGAGGTAMTGIYEFNGKGDGIVLPFSPVGWFETAANTLLNLELSGAVSADGSFVYVVVQ